MDTIPELISEHFPHRVSIDMWTFDNSAQQIKEWLFSNFSKDNYEYTYTGPIISPIQNRGAHIYEYVYVFANAADALEFKLVWQNTRNTQMVIDPPSGWKYGFPKRIPSNQLGRIHDWLVENGYPQSEINQFNGPLPCRIWEE